MRIHGIGDYPFIALRHTFAMRCLEQGFEIETLSEILGHADVTTTVALYARKSPENDEIAKKRSAMKKLAPVGTETKF
jgi:site-specific recombinase XerD